LSRRSWGLGSWGLGSWGSGWSSSWRSGWRSTVGSGSLAGSTVGVAWTIERRVVRKSDVGGASLEVADSLSVGILNRQLGRRSSGSSLDLSSALGNLDVCTGGVGLVFAVCDTFVYTGESWPLPDPVEGHGVCTSIAWNLEVGLAPEFRLGAGLACDRVGELSLTLRGDSAIVHLMASTIVEVVDSQETTFRETSTGSPLLNIQELLVGWVGGSVDVNKTASWRLAGLVLREGDVTVFEVLDGDKVARLGYKLWVGRLVGVDSGLSLRAKHLVGSNASTSSREANNHDRIAERWISTRNITTRVAWVANVGTVSIEDIHLLDPRMSRAGAG
jgi:hypothetical protein